MCIRDRNKNIYTGSVIKDKDGIYHAFYTAFNADIKINGKSVQSVMQATGTDPLHLETMEDFLFVADGVRYEEFDWRDPYVFWNEEEGCYYMLLAARQKDGGQLRGGCVALCKSKDLTHWTYEEPFYAPDMYVDVYKRQIVGCFMDTTPAMMVLSPILLPIALSIGMNPIHFGVIMVVNLAIGFITPPLGINLFVAARVGREPLETVTSGIVRFMVVMLLCLMLITFIPVSYTHLDRSSRKATG